MMFPKPKKRKKTRKPKESIMHKKDGRCYLCMKLRNDYGFKETHEHHVYPGGLRGVSTDEGFTAHLCLEHHIVGPEAVHNNQKNLRLIQKDCQKIYEKTHTRQQFMELTGRNYID